MVYDTLGQLKNPGNLPPEIMSLIRSFRPPQKLDLSGLKLDSLPPLDRNLLANVNGISIDCDGFFEIPTLRHLTNLSELDLRGCDRLRTLRALPDNLTSLKLGGKLLKELPKLSSLTNLTELDLSNCSKLRSLDTEALPPQMRIIGFRVYQRR